MSEHPAAALVAGGQAWPLGDLPTVIGRWDDAVGAAPAVDLSELDPTRSVSRRHAEIRWHAGHDWLTDLDSGNGTWVDGRRLACGEQVALTHGRLLQFGDVRVTYLSVPGTQGGADPENPVAEQLGSTAPGSFGTQPLGEPAARALAPPPVAGVGPALPPTPQEDLSPTPHAHQDSAAPAALGVDHWTAGETDPSVFVRTRLRRDAPTPPPAPSPAPPRRRWRRGSDG